eukprot:4160641-Lingulodinium_polyedra.AAC.1
MARCPQNIGGKGGSKGGGALSQVCLSLARPPLKAERPKVVTSRLLRLRGARASSSHQQRSSS